MTDIGRAGALCVPWGVIGRVAGSFLTRRALDPDRFEVFDACLDGCPDALEHFADVRERSAHVLVWALAKPDR